MVFDYYRIFTSSQPTRHYWPKDGNSTAVGSTKNGVSQIHWYKRVEISLEKGGAVAGLDRTD